MPRPPRVRGPRGPAAGDSAAPAAGVRGPRWARVLTALALALGACSPSSGRTAVTVLAAASLTDAFTDIEGAFEAAHPELDARLSFAGSQTLATQIRHGLRADAFASADAAHLEALHAEGLVASPRPFAGNSLVLARPKGSPAVDLAGLSAVERLVVGQPEVPVGRYTVALLEAAAEHHGDAWAEAVQARIVSREPNVRLARAKLLLGEADAAILYATDVAGVEGLDATPLPAAVQPAIALHQAALAEPTAGARAWLEFVDGPTGQVLLARHGFLPPPEPP
jgi:molybdate transport system substrate-binding protein